MCNHKYYDKYIMIVNSVKGIYKKTLSLLAILYSIKKI